MSENKIATKADLQRMYNKMLPYLGGMPEMVANKFSKGDLYSTEERMIGQWIDGKPLYQKVFEYNVDKSFNENTTWTETDITVASLGCDTIIEAKTWNNSKTLRYVDSSCDSTYVEIKLCDSNNKQNITYRKILLTYTKLADSPISIGSDTDYSTEEKIVGTWVDGKPIYQKSGSFSKTDFESGTNNWNYYTLLNLPNNINIIKINGMVSITDYGVTIIGTKNILNGSNSWSTNFSYAKRITLDVQNISIAGKDINLYITLQYTKTTD